MTKASLGTALLDNSFIKWILKPIELMLSTRQEKQTLAKTPRIISEKNPEARLSNHGPTANDKR